MSAREPSLRARDSDREQVITALDDARVEGQLSDEDHDFRVGAALEARTMGDLELLLNDIRVPEPIAFEPEPEPDRRWRLYLAGFATVAAVFTAALLWPDGESPPRQETAPPPAVVERQPPVIEEPAEALTCRRSTRSNWSTTSARPRRSWASRVPR